MRQQRIIADHHYFRSVQSLHQNLLVRLGTLQESGGQLLYELMSMLALKNHRSHESCFQLDSANLARLEDFLSYTQ